LKPFSLDWKKFAMANWYLVRFSRAGEVHYFKAGGLQLEPGDFCIARTHRGREYGCIVRILDEMPRDLKVSDSMGEIESRAGDQEFQIEDENREREKEAFSVCEKEISRLVLDMRLVRVHCLHDRSRIVFYFKAAGKVDFRELVKSLAGYFKTRIEMKQIGVRDEAKILGGFGPCGRTTCCSTWLTQFNSVVIKMAKTQNLSLNPTKISGLCGRLMCCLGYEQSTYERAFNSVPRIGRDVVWKGERGRIVSINPVQEYLVVEFEREGLQPLKITFEESAEMEVPGRGKPRCAGGCHGSRDEKMTRGSEDAGNSGSSGEVSDEKTEISEEVSERIRQTEPEPESENNVTKESTPPDSGSSEVVETIGAEPGTSVERDGRKRPRGNRRFRKPKNQ
jgi:cell fate regulator YaaT (PSP1 superfamily)